MENQESLEALIEEHIIIVLKDLGVTALCGADHIEIVAPRVAASIWSGPQGPNEDEVELIKALINLGSDEAFYDLFTYEMCPKSGAVMLEIL